jgi:hypothetical protein
MVPLAGLASALPPGSNTWSLGEASASPITVGESEGCRFESELPYGETW